MNENGPARHPGRSVLAIFVGFLLIVVLSTVVDLCLHATGIFPPPGQPMNNGLWLLALGYRVVFAVVGCYVAARMAPDRPMWHVMVLGFVGLLLGTVGVVATWNQGPGFGPKWYPILVAATAIPSAWLGGMLHTRGTRTLPSS